MLLAIMDLITNSLGTPRPTLVKWSRGIESAPFVSEYEAAEIWFWHRTDHDIAEQRWLDTERSRSVKEDPENIPNLPLRYWTTQLTNSRQQEIAEWAHYHVLQVWHTPSTPPAAVTVTTSPTTGLTPSSSRPATSRTTISKQPQPQQSTPAASTRPPPGPPPTPMSAAIPIQPTVHPQPMAIAGQSSSAPFPPQPPAPSEAVARSRSRDQPRPHSTPSSQQSMQQDEHPRPPAPPPGRAIIRQVPPIPSRQQRSRSRDAPQPEDMEQEPYTHPPDDHPGRGRTIHRQAATPTDVPVITSTHWM
eukprot:5834267-Amphidinium_carterae.2